MKASEYIRKGWTQGSVARDLNGDAEASMSARAVSWCVAGAITASYRGVRGAERAEIASNRLRNHLRTDCLALWNDSPERTQAEVIAALEAIGE